MKVSVKEEVDSIIREFQKEFGLLDEIQTPIGDISSISCLEEISSAIEELIQNLNEIVEDTTVRLEELDNFSEEEEE